MHHAKTLKQPCSRHVRSGGGGVGVGVGVGAGAGASTATDTTVTALTASPSATSASLSTVAVVPSNVVFTLVRAAASRVAMENATSTLELLASNRRAARRRATSVTLVTVTSDADTIVYSVATPRLNLGAAFASAFHSLALIPVRRVFPYTNFFPSSSSRRPTPRPTPRAIAIAITVAIEIATHRRVIVAVADGAARCRDRDRDRVPERRDHQWVVHIHTVYPYMA